MYHPLKCIRYTTCVRQRILVCSPRWAPSNAYLPAEFQPMGFAVLCPVQQQFPGLWPRTLGKGSATVCGLLWAASLCPAVCSVCSEHLAHHWKNRITPSWEDICMNWTLACLFAPFRIMSQISEAQISAAPLTRGKHPLIQRNGSKLSLSKNTKYSLEKLIFKWPRGNSLAKSAQSISYLCEIAFCKQVWLKKGRKASCLIQSFSSCTLMPLCSLEGSHCGVGFSGLLENHGHSEGSWGALPDAISVLLRVSQCYSGGVCHLPHMLSFDRKTYN